MKFEYDEKKSQINKEKRKIYFVEAQKLWQDEDALVVPANKVNVDFPEWVIESLDKEAKKISVTRQSIIKVWISERLKEEATHLQAS